MRSPSAAEPHRPAVAGGAPEPDRVAQAVLAETGLALRPPLTARRVGGGYSWRTYVVADAAGSQVVVRVAPPGGTMSPYDPHLEARAIRASAGVVPAPRVLAVVDGPNALGAPYGVHTFAAGEVRRLSQVPDAERAAHRSAFATALGRLHGGADAAALDPAAAAGTTTQAMRRDIEATVAAFSRGAPCRHPGFTVGVRWLLTHLPHVEDRPRLCHGDFRLHNLAWDRGELSAVLDWERAWVGDPMVDVAFTRRFSGWCSVGGDAVAAYESAAGIRIDEARVTYGDTYEQVRSYTSAARGWRALAEGRDDALPLHAIGEAGRAGAWALVDLLADGPLQPAPPDGLAPEPLPVLTDARLAAVAAAAHDAGQHDLAAHLAADAEEDERATAASVAALRTALPALEGAAVGPALAAALAPQDPAAAWAAAHAVLAGAAAGGGAELIAPLRALGRRHTDRATLLPHAARDRRGRR